MSTQIDFSKVAPEIMNPLFAMGKVLASSGLDPTLRTLIEIRASQINGCAFCLALHHREATAEGQSNDRILGLSAWREAPWYSDRERAALAWTEALTLVGNSHPSADLDTQMREHFTEKEIVHVTYAIMLINAWNRLNVACHTNPEAAEAYFKSMHAQPAHA